MPVGGWVGGWGLVTPAETGGRMGRALQGRLGLPACLEGCRAGREKQHSSIKGGGARVAAPSLRAPLLL